MLALWAVVHSPLAGAMILVATFERILVPVSKEYNAHPDSVELHPVDQCFYSAVHITEHVAMHSPLPLLR